MLCEKNGKNGYVVKDWIYFGHKDEICSYNADEVESGYKVYVSAESDVICDGYSGKIGNPADFKKKVYAELFCLINGGEERFYKNTDGEEDCCEVIWSEVLNVIKTEKI